MSIPDWVHEAVLYQIFPDRFANGDLNNDPVNKQPWGTPPTIHGFQGGDIAGILQKLDYLADLGVNLLYLNPIFMAASPHRYDTIDYYRIDPKLGTLDDFHRLIAAAHQRGMRVILDGVFNHVGRGFFAFADILENEKNSPYLDWFHVRRFPLRAYDPGESENYLAWWGIKSLPKFNTGNPAVRNYLLGVARYWIEQGADGWRLDVPNEIDDDSFWAEFRAVVHQANPQAYLLGEIWEIGPRWANDSHFDGLMNYPLRTAVLQMLTGKQTTHQFADQIETLLAAYPPENTQAMCNLLGSHDTERLLTHLGGSLEKVRLAYLFLFAYPGIPAIYYGDEVGLEGEKDPDCRRAFPWETSQQNQALHDWVKHLVAVRKSEPALQRGTFRLLYTSDQPAVYAFARIDPQDAVLVVLNASPDPACVRLPIAGLGFSEGQTLHGLLDDRHVVVQNDQIDLSLPGFSGAYLRA